MRKTDRLQRIEEIQLALASAFESPKSPSVASYDEGATLYIQLSWVLESRGDTSLDARCVVTLRFSQTQIDSYADMDTAKRQVIQQRLKAAVQKRFGESQSPPAREGDCAIEMNVDDSLLNLPDEPYSIAP
ncbi:hypothetical protein [Paraburkholderia rhynchosiae]|uniref:DUF3022 domain-containing protein n=1 Tax=Paraburkholderia rhynchosiae TaxID=487049 RepID=A0A2N7WMD1_9BURK|nr:hypothetical protein [Paraburkholderia rhynchosiae]PMS30586.1 hypothetical protein C0Z16_13545 [Paraburkholderia rhynchosiae]CAB3684251.1 hypothetical protein LMG27174_02815 [Paraburkholderia rhynchosiae]